MINLTKTYTISTKGAFGCYKMFSGKYIFSENANFWKRKMFSAVWLSRKSFSRKPIPVFDSSKHFTENTLQKSFYGKSFPVFGLWIIFTENMKCVTNSSTCIRAQPCNSTKLIIHCNIKNNHSN